MLRGFVTRRRAARAAYASGLLLVVSGATGAVGVFKIGWTLLNAVSPQLGEATAPLVAALALLAALGGITVAGGGHLIEKGLVWPGRTMIQIGAGTGVIGFALHLGLLVAGGSNPFVALFSSVLTLQGLGVTLALYAQLVR